MVVAAERCEHQRADERLGHKTGVETRRDMTFGRTDFEDRCDQRWCVAPAAPRLKFLRWSSRLWLVLFLSADRSPHRV